ncbi:MAG: hypothetical protein M0020_03820 [Actinomycetota bacterium]|jgi:hypothetical protein|nr:hypothetical protein [Actinomycetota bacterium]
MFRSVIEHRLREVQGRLVRARAELAVIDEQLGQINDEADDARIRALVAETPISEREWTETSRHRDAALRNRRATAETIAELERRRDDLLHRLPSRVS